MKNNIKNFEEMDRFEALHDVIDNIKGGYYEAMFAIKKDLEQMPTDKLHALRIKLCENDACALEMYNVMRKWSELGKADKIPEEVEA